MGGSDFFFLRRLFLRWFRPDPLKNLVSRGLVVGKNFKMQDGVQIDWSHCWLIEIGDDVGLAPRVHIIAHDGSTNRFLGETRLGRVKIGNKVFVGASSIILPGVEIGNRVIIGAGSVVSRDVPDNVVVAGNPARPICSLDEFLQRRGEEMGRVPHFGPEFTHLQNPSKEMKAEMLDRMVDGIGYII